MKYIFLTCTFLLAVLLSMGQSSAVLNVSYVKSQLKGLSYIEQIEILNTAFQDRLHTHPKLSEEIMKLALQMSYDHKDSTNVAESLFSLGQAYREHGKSNESIEYFSASQLIFSKLNNKSRVIDCINELGTANKNIGNYQKALNYDFEALKASEEFNYLGGIINSNLNIAVIFLLQKDYKKSIEYLNKNLPLQKNDSLGLITTYNNLGTSYKGLKKYEDALKYYEQSLNIAILTKNEHLQGKPLNNIGVLYLERKEFSQALEYFNKVKEIETKTGNKRGLIGTYLNIGIIHRYTSEYEEAIHSFLIADSLSIETKSMYEQKMVFLNISLTYEEWGKYLKSLDYLYSYITLNDALFNESKNQQLAELESKYEAEKNGKEIELLKKERNIKELAFEKQRSEIKLQELRIKAAEEKKQSELALLQNQNEIQKLVLEKNINQIESLELNASLDETKIAAEKSKAEKETTIRNVTILISLLIVIPILVLLIFYQQKIKAQSIVSIRTEQLNQKKILELIKDFEIKTFKAQLEGQEIEKKRIASDLHDGIGGNLASIKLGLNKLEDNLGSNQAIKKLKAQLNETCKEVRTISHDLTPSKILNSAYVGLIKEYILVSLDSSSIQVHFQAYPENKINNISDEIKIEIYRIIQELLSNVLQHSQATDLDISLNLNEESLILMMEDSGVGFNPNKALKGIGLLNIKSRVASVNGKLTIDSIIGRGTIFTVEIPLIINTVV